MQGIQVFLNVYIGKEAGRPSASSGMAEFFEDRPVMMIVCIHDIIWKFMMPHPCQAVGGVRATMSPRPVA